MVWEQLPRGFSHPFALVLLQMESWLSGEEASFSKENGNIQIFFFPSCSRFSKSAAAFPVLNTELTIQFIPKGKWPSREEQRAPQCSLHPPKSFSTLAFSSPKFLGCLAPFTGQ